MKRIGLLGGSFNPAHRGHRRISLAAWEALGLDEVWWLVSPGNPLKKTAPDMAPFEARFASAVRMARRAPIRVKDFEARAGTRYTIDTLAKLQQRYPPHRFIWLMGADTVAQFHQWKDWRRLARRVPIAVIARPGYDGAARAARAMGWLRRFVRHRARHASGRIECTGDFAASPAARSTSATGLRALDPNWHRRKPRTGPIPGRRRAIPRRRPLARTNPGSPASKPPATVVQ